MKTVSEKAWLAAVGLIVLYSMYPNGVVIAENVVVDGLGPLGPVSASGVAPMVNGKRLEIPVPGHSAISIAGWPAFMPQQFVPQKVEASRMLRPSGPSDRFAFTRMAEDRPWLLVGTGALPASELFDGWHLQFDGKEWALSNGEQEKHLRTANKPARPTIVAHGKERWCVYLLSYDAPESQEGIAGEKETRAAWAAVRLSSGKRHCAE
jgi:hypothetical protein